MIQTIALAGNPNAGKTTLFNALTGMRQRVGNWSGVTVERKCGTLKLGDESIQVVDLPGVYDLSVEEGAPVDEQIAFNFLKAGEADVVVNIVDASNLERHLYLTTQLLDLGVPVVIALNMSDVAAKQGIYIDTAKLSKATGCKVVETALRGKKGLDKLKETIQSVLTEKPKPAKKRIAAKPEKRYAQVKEWLGQCLKFGPAKSHVTKVIDKIVLNTYLGLPIFFFVMYLMFQFAITLGTALQPLFDEGSSVLFIHGLAVIGHDLHLPTWLTAVLSEGIGLGLNTVLTFIPQVGLMFLFLSFLEDSGYMARAAFVMDRVMKAVGLPGKAFVPLIVGFGCNVPAIMAARTLESRRDRLLTIMMSPFMSCGARLAIFAVFASAFFPHSGAFVVFVLYLTGIFIALLTALLMKKTLLKGKSVPFLIELPTYHLPQFKIILSSTWQRLKRFLTRAGKVIIPICILVGTLNAIQPNGKFVPGGSEHSALSSVAKMVTPIFHPIGIEQNNWPATVGLATGAIAKEVVIGTLNTLYTQRNDLPDVSNFSFAEGLKTAWHDTVQSVSNIPLSSFINPFTANEASTEMSHTSMGHMVHAFGSQLAAFAFLLFVLLYIPCVSTAAVTAKEAGNGWAVFSTLWSISIAYVAALVVYQGGLMFEQFMWSQVYWVVGGLLFLFGLVFGMHKVSPHLKISSQNKANPCGGCGCQLKNTK